MEQKTFYVAPKAEFSAAKIRCSILAGSNTSQAGERPTTGGNPGGVDNPGMPVEDGARVRKGTLGF